MVHVFIDEFFSLIERYHRTLMFCLLLFTALILVINMAVVYTASTLLGRAVDKIKDEADKSGYISEQYIKRTISPILIAGAVNDNTIKNLEFKTNVTPDELDSHLNNWKSLPYNAGIVITKNAITENTALEYGDKAQFILYRKIELPFLFLPNNRVTWIIKKKSSFTNRGNIGDTSGSHRTYGYRNLDGTLVDD